MADVELDNLRQRRDGLGCSIVEAMAGMHFQTEPRCALGTVTNNLPLGFRLTHTPFSQCITPAPGVDFDRRCAELGRHFDLRGRRADKKRNADPGSLERADRRRQLRALADGVETTFGGAFGAPLRHEASGMRFGLESDVNHFVGGRHFKIERLIDLGL